MVEENLNFIMEEEIRGAGEILEYKSKYGNGWKLWVYLYMKMSRGDR